MVILLATAERLTNANESITHLGIGGIFALLVIREVFGFIRNRKENMNGNTPITRTEFDNHKNVAQYKDNCHEIVKRIENEFRAIEVRDKCRIKVVDDNFKFLKEDLKEVKTLIKNGNK